MLLCGVFYSSWKATGASAVAFYGVLVKSWDCGQKPSDPDLGKQQTSNQEVPAGQKPSGPKVKLETPWKLAQIMGTATESDSDSLSEKPNNEPVPSQPRDPAKVTPTSQGYASKPKAKARRGRRTKRRGTRRSGTRTRRDLKPHLTAAAAEEAEPEEQRIQAEF